MAQRKLTQSQMTLDALRKQYEFSLQTTVRNGFPVIAWYDVNPADPSTGDFTPYIDGFHLTTTSGFSTKWMNLTPQEFDDIGNQIVREI